MSRMPWTRKTPLARPGHPLPNETGGRTDATPGKRLQELPSINKRR